MHRMVDYRVQMRQRASVLALAAVVVAAAGSAGSLLTASGDEPSPTATAAAPLFSEKFEGDLSGWFGKGGGPHNGRIVRDPLRNGNKVLTFAGLQTGGDIFSEQIAVGKRKTYRLKFDYLGQPGRGGVKDDLGGTFGISIMTPGHARWLAGTQTVSAEAVSLKDDGKWHTYEIEFSPGSKPWFTPDGTRAVTLRSIPAIRMMLEDNAGSKGVPGDAFFDNISLTECAQCSQQDVKVQVSWHANNLQTEPPGDAGDCTGNNIRARVTGKLSARFTGGDHQGGGDDADHPHRSRCRVPGIDFKVDRVRLEVVEPGQVLRAILSVHITQQGAHRPGQCKVGTDGRITAVYDNTGGAAANGLRNDSLRIGQWEDPCGAHNHRINNNISSIPADASSSTWVRVFIGCTAPPEAPGYSPRNCGKD